MDQTKNDSLNNNDIENTYDVAILYTSTWSYTNIVLPEMSWSSLSTKKIKFILIKVNDEYECPADTLCERPCQIY